MTLPLLAHFTKNNPPPLLHRQLFIAGFFAIVLFALGADSRLLLEKRINGQILSNIFVPLYFLFMLGGLKPDQRRIALAFIPFSALGEFIFSIVFQLYAYKFNAVPFYVPFGHAILLSTGLLIADVPFLKINEQTIKYILLTIYVIIFSSAVLIFHDSMSALFSVIFGIILWKKKAPLFYLIMGFLVLYVELVGTALGCWAWDKSPWIFHTTNPPVGALIIYVIGDILIMKIVPRLTSLINQVSRNRVNPLQ